MEGIHRRYNDRTELGSFVSSNNRDYENSLEVDFSSNFDDLSLYDFDTFDEASQLSDTSFSCVTYDHDDRMNMDEEIQVIDIKDSWY
jgi:hypothetical protein